MTEVAFCGGEETYKRATSKPIECSLCSLCRYKSKHQQLTHLAQSGQSQSRAASSYLRLVRNQVHPTRRLVSPILAISRHHPRSTSASRHSIPLLRDIRELPLHGQPDLSWHHHSSCSCCLPPFVSLPPRVVRALHLSTFNTSRIGLLLSPEF